MGRHGGVTNHWLDTVGNPARKTHTQWNHDGSRVDPKNAFERILQLGDPPESHHAIEETEDVNHDEFGVRTREDANADWQSSGR
jgi:hypothetical protein